MEHNAPLDKIFLNVAGESLLHPLYESVKKAANGEMITEEFKVRFNKEANIRKLFEHFHKCKVDANLVSQKRVVDTDM